jgi:outer membrane autotransporter protein
VESTTSVTLSGGQNTFNTAVEAGTKIAISGTSNNTFEDGLESKGTAATDGIEITGGKTDVIAGSLTSASSVKISGGNNTFAGTVEANGTSGTNVGLVLSGTSTNTFDGPVQSLTNLTITGANTENNFNGAVTTTGTGNSNGIFINGGDKTKASATFEGVVTTASGSAGIVVNQALVKLDSGAGIAGGTLSIEDEGVVKLGADVSANGNVTVQNGGTLDVGEHTLTMGASATLELQDGSTVVFNAPDASTMGSIAGNGATLSTLPGTVEIIIDGTLPDIVTNASQDLFSGFGAYNVDSATEFYNPVYNIVLGTGGLTINGTHNPASMVSNPTQNDIRAGAAIQQIVSSGGPISAELQTILGHIDAGQHLGGDNLRRAFSKLIGEGLVNVSNAVNQVSMKVQGSVFRRLEDIRVVSAGFTPSAGSTDALNRIWLTGFGSWADQKNRAGIPGYKYDSTGVAIGYDRYLESIDGLTLGIATAFSTGTLKTNDGISKVDIETIAFAVYGSYALQNGVFFDSLIAYGWTKNKSTVDLMGDQKVANFNGNTFQFCIRGGIDLRFGNFEIAPSLGVRYFHYSQENLAEHARNGNVIPNVVDSYSADLVEIPFLVKFRSNIETASYKLIPEVRLGWTYVAKRPDENLSVGFVGSPVRYNLSGVQPTRSYFQGGVGLKLETPASFDLSLNYDTDLGKNFSEHRVTLELGYRY